MAGPAVQRILDKLDGVKAASGGHIARCPGHDDKKQSLKIDERADGSVLLHCHAGCDKQNLLSAMGLTFADLFAPKDGNSGASQHLVAVYDYHNLDGTLAYQSLRYSPKEFRQRRPDGAGGWVWNMAAVKDKKVPYRLPKLKNVPVVIVVEGEKDADRLSAAGLQATTNIGGAGKWGYGETAGLKAAGVKRVVVIPDNDEAGHKHAESVAASCKTAGLAVSIIDLPDLKAKGDVSDWLDAGHVLTELEALLAGQLYVVPPGSTVTPAPSTAVVGGLQPSSYHMTDLGAAESLRDRFGNMMRYDHQRKEWLIWNGHLWRPDVDDEAFRLAHEHVRLLQTEAMTIIDYARRKEVADWALAREKRTAMTAMLAHASTMKPMAISGDAWDADGWLFACTNGVVDLRTGLLRPGDREDHITLQSGTAFDPAATCPRWEQFLQEIFEGDAGLIDYIHKAVGYSMTGDMREQCFFVAFGNGSNGKSAFIDTLERVFGAYSHRADMRMFAGFSSDSNSFHNADFRGKRMVTAAEVKPNSHMNEHVLKHFTGGETLRAEHKYGRSFTIRPVGKIWLGVNHRPKVADDSYGFWRRVRLIPFLAQFTGSSDNRQLKTQLQAEASGILAWAVRGCLKWQAEGLAAPRVVQDATDSYQQGEDVLADFFADRLSFEDPYALCSFAKLYATYREWASSQGISDSQKLSAKAMGNMMQTRPFDRVKQNNAVCYKGITICAVNLF